MEPDKKERKQELGKEEEFEVLYQKYQTPVHHFIYRIIKSDEDSKDLTQESFMKVYKHLDRYKRDKKFSTWLFSIARNTTYDWLRKKKRRRELLIIDDPDTQINLADSNANPIHLKTHIDINTAMKKIKENHRKILALYFQGYSYSEMAAKLNKPLNTVKTSIRRAKQEFQEKY